MQITAVETLHLGEFPNVLWTRLHTDSGLTGVGETYFGARAVEAFVHETAAPVLLGANPLDIQALSRKMTPYVGYSGTGAETRGRSALDVALWDIAGKQAGQPIYRLLGGPSRERIRTYNTCAGYRYVRSHPDWSTSDWGTDREPEGPYEDLDAFLHRADELALSLIEEGITGMKIWPFDFAAEKSDGHYISNADLEQALEPFHKIRDAVGERMDIMVELHGLWRMPAVKTIAAALEPFGPFWIEDPVRPDSLSALVDFAASTTTPVCGCETLGGEGAFSALIESGAVDIVMPDVVWCGGITEIRKIAAIAERHHRPLAPHDCTGPIAFMAAVHCSLALPNVLIQESVRAFHSGWYRELVTEVPTIDAGYILPPSGPGLGTELLPGLESRSDASRTVSE